MTTRTTTLDSIPLTFTDEGDGKPLLLLHGGGGPSTVAAFASMLAAERGFRVLTPTHPGFQGTQRPESLDSIAGLAALYVTLLDHLELTDVTVVGNSIGGWIAAEMSLLRSPSVSGYVLADAAGVDLADDPVPNFFDMTMAKVAEVSYFRPAAFTIDVEALPPAARAAMAGNRASLAVYAGPAMSDPTLLDRLPTAAGPTLVVWGTADRMITAAHGAAYAAALPGARLEMIDECGHLPQLEAPGPFADLLVGFAEL